MFTADDLGKLILLSYWGPMLLLMAFALWAVWKWLPFGKAAKAVAALAVLVAVPALFILPLFQVVKADKKKEDEYQQRYQAAKAVFDRQCQNAGEKIYRTVDNVEGIMLLRVREKYTDGKGRDPMWDDAAALSGSSSTDNVENIILMIFCCLVRGREWLLKVTCYQPANTCHVTAMWMYYSRMANRLSAIVVVGILEENH